MTIRSLLVCVLGVAAMSACKSSDNPMNDLSGDAGVDLSVHHDLSKVDGPVDLSTFDGADLSHLPDLANADMYTPLFRSVVSYSVEHGPKFIAAADVNSDGKRDFVVINYNDPLNPMTPVPSTVNVLLGNGDGTFQTKMSSPISAGPYAIAIADMNGDTKLDLVISFQSGYTLLTGKGDGTFNIPAIFSLASTSVRQIAIGDIDGDTKADVILSDLLNGVWVALGDGNGNFGTATAFPVSTMTGSNRRYPVALRLGDMDGNGTLDVVTSNVTGSVDVNSVSILPNSSTVGTAVLSATPLEISSGRRPQNLLVAQLDNANKLDLIVANANDNSVSVFLSDTAGSALTFNAAATYSVGIGPAALAFSDIDGDTKVDLITADSLGNTITILYGGGGGLFGQASASRPGSESYSVGTNPISLVTGPFNADVKIDVATANQQSDDISVLINQR